MPNTLFITVTRRTGQGLVGLSLLTLLLLTSTIARGDDFTPRGLAGLNNKPGMAFDHYTFAALWMPGVCHSWQDIGTICQTTANESPEAREFTLHGLWPSAGSAISRAG